jgi:hypothetical protein
MTGGNAYVTERTVSRVQHVNIKIFAGDADIDLTDAIPVFHRWIQEDLCEELLIDVADYKHVPDGPGIMLIGHQANYSLDQLEGKLGLLYNRKANLDGDSQAALRQAFVSALGASIRLEGEPPFAGKLRFDAGNVEVIVNDRLVAPNTDATWQALKPELERFFARVYGDGGFSLEHVGEPRDRFRVSVRAKNPITLSAALAAIQA